MQKVEHVYKPLTLDVSDWRTASNGCIEERDTYFIDDYSNVDLDRALDLDLDRIPDRTDPSTQWRPMFPDVIYVRSMRWNGTGSFTKPEVTSTENFLAPASAGFATCPPKARKLGTMTSDELDAYLSTIKASGTTYHDIGMIWGGRLISPSGLFASENTDLSPGAPTSRHLIFLTDGQTEPLDLSYSTYGIEPLDARRWDNTSSDSLAAVIEKRFGVACSQVGKRNITVWVIGFGTSLNPVMTNCAGEGHFFVAEDAKELNATFATIAKSLSDLRVTR